MKVNAERKVIIKWKHYQTLDDMKPNKPVKIQSVKYCPTFATTQLVVTIVGEMSNLRPALTIQATVYAKYSVATSVPRLHTTIKRVSELTCSSHDTTQSLILNTRKIGKLRSTTNVNAIQAYYQPCRTFTFT